MSAAEPLEVPSLQKRLDKATILGGAAATIMALLAGLLTRDTDWSPPSWLLVVSGVLLLWYVVTLLGRLTLVRAKDSTMPTPPIFFRWLGARFAIFFAMPILLFCWLASLPLGTPWAGIAGRALFLLLGLNVLIALIGYSIINSALLVERMRRRQ